MATVALFDTGPLGLATRRPGIPERDRLHAWIGDLEDAGGEVVIPGIADYELRRELILQGLVSSIMRLDILIRRATHDPISDPVMRKAAELWAVIRKAGQPTADPKALDGDCILAAHSLLLDRPGDKVIVITDNITHLGRFPGIVAQRWEDVDPAKL